MPRGLPPTLNVAVTLSVVVSITDTEAEPSLDTYANGDASALSAVVVDMTAAQIMDRARRMTTFLLELCGAPQWSRCPQSVMLHEFATTHRHPDRGRTFTAPRISDSPRSGRRGDRRTVAADRAG